MFRVKKKADPDGPSIKIYGTTKDKAGYIQFLIYENNQWKWVSAKHYYPYDFLETINKASKYPIDWI